jgi:peptide deformylase
MTIVVHPAPVLEEPALPVDLTDVSFLDIAADLLIALADTDGALAVAAQQIGATSRMFAYRTPAGGLEVLVNPKIIEARGKRLGKERCLSFPDEMFMVERAQAVTVAALTLEGDPIRHRWHDKYARMAQHEVDHLDGILVPSRGRRIG